MSTLQKTGSARFFEIAAMLARWLLGIVFLYMGLNKALHPIEFLKLVRQYEMVNSPALLNSIAAALPWFEIFCGLLLLAGIAVRGSALMLILMLVPFSLLVFKRALAVQAAQAILFCQVKFDCGCGTGEVFICPKLLENCALILLSAWLVLGRGRQFSLRYNLLKSGSLEAEVSAATDLPPETTGEFSGQSHKP